MGASPRFHHSWFRKKVAVAVSAIQPETSNFFCGTCWICSWIAGHIAVLKCIKYDKVDSPCLKMGMFALRKKFFQHGISDNDPIFMGRWWWTIEILGHRWSMTPSVMSCGLAMLLEFKHDKPGSLPWLDHGPDLSWWSWQSASWNVKTAEVISETKKKQTLYGWI
jgi:hypothetical protein